MTFLRIISWVTLFLIIPTTIGYYSYWLHGFYAFGIISFYLIIGYNFDLDELIDKKSIGMRTEAKYMMKFLYLPAKYIGKFLITK